MERLDSQTSPERQPEHQSDTETNTEALGRSHETVNEEHERARQAEQLKQAHAEVQAEAKRGAELSSLGTEKAPSTGAHRSTQKKTAYRQTLRATQAQLSPTRRIFSRFIHNRAIEATSETLSRTVLRPLPLLSAGLFAFVMTGVVYVLGRSRGYDLVGGGWWLISLAVGYSFGLIYDLLRLLWQRHRQS